MLSTVREAAAAGPSIGDVATSSIGDVATSSPLLRWNSNASTSDIVASIIQTIDGGASDSGVGALIGVSVNSPVDDISTGDVRSLSDGVCALINNDDDASICGIAASTIRTVDVSSQRSWCSLLVGWRLSPPFAQRSWCFDSLKRRR
jgi:hypothetical protein